MQEMQQIYATGTVGDADRCIRLEAGGTGEDSLEDIMANSGTGLNLVTIFSKLRFLKPCKTATRSDSGRGSAGLRMLEIKCARNESPNRVH